ncbi:MAG: hypothetical protein AVDCRST_MAG85-1272 [uncultured Solirubrobacteraceae bacterium]|uniref:Uncharacterized protein n=1 Tax=uncultured Solirubrobacteraceae bacterium TaxID=1162706 RepID=A0A6J4SED0_9ACTN|nr:MAG: hypothetical protein AVDCRST_MAG85-1272 [uncultured Solirubrobacteraceae bacterium]
MGLLDDAIREHLELKRLHGADPAEVAAQEREVLSGGRPAAAEPAEPASADVPVADAPATEVAPPPAEAHDDPFADLGPPPPPPPRPERHAGAVSAFAAPDPDVEIDWSEPAPIREPDPAPAAEAEGEDVLEETPEFLEETPEHDRLWFEQRPPKDFDF